MIRNDGTQQCQTLITCGCAFQLWFVMLRFRNLTSAVAFRRPLISSYGSLLEPVVTNDFEAQTRQIFHNDTIDKLAVYQYLDRDMEHMSISDLSYVLYCAGLRRIVLKDKYLHLISVAISQSRGEFRRIDISRLLYGLIMFKSSPTTTSFVNAMAVVMRHQAPATFDARSLGMCLYGLQNLSSDVSGMDVILQQLNARLVPSEIVFDEHTLSNSFRALNCKKSTSPPVRELLSILYSKIANCDHDMDAHHFSRCLRCFADMTSNEVEVRGVLSALAVKGSRCYGVFTGDDIQDMLWGLQQMNSTHEEVQDILQVIADIIRGQKLTFTARSMSRTLYSLRQFKPKVPAVTALFKELAVHMETSKIDHFSGSEFAHSLLGLQHCTITQSGIPTILGVLASSVSLDSKTMTYNDIKTSFCGLRNMVAANQSVKQILKKLTSELRSIDEKLSSVMFSFILGSIKHMDSECVEVRSLIGVVADKLEATEGNISIGDSKYFFLYHLHGMNSNCAEVIRLLRVITPALSHTPASSITGKDIGLALYGMSGMTSHPQEVRAILRMLVHDWQDKVIRLDGQAVGTAVYGLQNMSPEYEEVRQLIALLAEMIQRSSSTAKLSAQAACMAVYGLKSMEASYPEVRKLLSAITPLVKQCDGDFNTVNASNVLYGLRRMNSDYEEVRTLLEVLAVKLDCCSGMRYMDVSIALFGMRNMNSSHGAVRDVLVALKRQLDNTMRMSKRSEGLTNAYMAKALFGMNKMTGDYEIVTELLKSLNKAYSNTKRAKFSPQELCMCLYGLRGMSSKEPQVVSLLNRVVVPRLPSESHFNPIQLGQTLEGMRNFSADDEAVRRLITYMVGILGNSGNKTLHTKEVLSCVQGLLTICKSDTPEVKDLVTAITDYFKSCEFTLTSTDLKHCLYLLAPFAKSNPDVQALCNEIEAHRKY